MTLAEHRQTLGPRLAVGQQEEGAAHRMEIWPMKGWLADSGAPGPMM
jgi:hypothetical protein